MQAYFLIDNLNNIIKTEDHESLFIYVCMYAWIGVLSSHTTHQFYRFTIHCMSINNRKDFHKRIINKNLLRSRATYCACQTDVLRF